VLHPRGKHVKEPERVGGDGDEIKRSLHKTTNNQ